MTAVYAPISGQAQPYQNIPAEALHDCHSLPNGPADIKFATNSALRHLTEDLLDKGQSLKHLPDPNPDARIDVAVTMRAELELELVVRRVTKPMPCIESPARRPAYVATAAVLMNQFRRDLSGADGSVLQ